MIPGGKLLLNIAFYLCSCMCFAETASPVICYQLADTGIKAPVFDKDEEFFQTLFKNNPGKFDSINLHRVGWNVQVIYTQIDRNANGIPSFKNFYFNKKDARYFYPASLVKLPVAALVLQKLHELPFPSVTINSSMITGIGYSGQTAQYIDPNTPDGRPTIAQYIKEMLLVSDNNAFNRLYELLGQDYINQQLAAKGYKDARIIHRLDLTLTDDENRHTNPVSFFNKPIRQPVYVQPMQNSTVEYQKRNDFIGQSHYADTTLIDTAMDFSQKNRISLESLHTILLSLVFPAKVKAEQRFNLTEADRLFLLKYMSELPGESTYPAYDSSYADAYSKFILFGGNKGPMPKQIRIFNKTGEAYGQLTDVAYVVDFDKKIEFMVSATIYCNEDEILNDDKYDYDRVGLPFMKDLGKALYEYELKRKRNILPDLSSLIFSYDK